MGTQVRANTDKNNWGTRVTRTFPNVIGFEPWMRARNTKPTGAAASNEMPQFQNFSLSSNRSMFSGLGWYRFCRIPAGRRADTYGRSIEVRGEFPHAANLPKKDNHGCQWHRVADSADSLPWSFPHQIMPVHLIQASYHRQRCHCFNPARLADRYPVIDCSNKTWESTGTL